MNLQGKEVMEIAGYEDKWKEKKEEFEFEPTSVLHMRSPSDSTSVSTLSSSFAGGDNTAGGGYLQPETPLAGFEVWESMVSGTAASLTPEQFLLRWISGDVDGSSFGQMGVSGTISAAGDPNSAFSGSGFYSLPLGMMHQGFESPDEKPQLLTSHQNPNFFVTLPFTGQQEQHHQPQPTRRHNSAAPEPPFSDSGHEFFPRKLHHQNQHLGFSPATRPGAEAAQALVDQLYQAAELVGTGNFSQAQVILARLNHQLSPAGNSLHRAAFYFKEALQLLLTVALQPRTQAPVDFIFKLGAHKLFSELSPITHFINFTSNQALLEALNNSDRTHIFDFDLGSGAQWPSFMQELPVASYLKITAFASPSIHHPLELELIRENLTQFAIEIGLNFELELINFDSFDQYKYPLPNDSIPIAVNFPLRSFSDQPSILHFIKTLSPKIMVSSDRGGCDRSDLPFPQYLLQALQTHVHLFESLEAVNAAPANVDMIERFLLQPMIERTVLGRLRSPEKVPFWRTLFASAGFSPVPFSDLTGAQVECVVRRAPVRGFHVEKRQGSLSLCWQSRELVSASAWRC